MRYALLRGNQIQWFPPLEEPDVVAATQKRGLMIRIPRVSMIVYTQRHAERTDQDGDRGFEPGFLQGGE